MFLHSMKRANRNFVLGIVGLMLLVVGALPAYYYLKMFGHASLSSQPENWGVFGDYIGGVYNPIISLASLLTLAYLTYLVAKQTGEESKRLFILQRRMEAYDEVAKYLSPINSFNGKLKSSMSMVATYQKLPPDQAIQCMLKLLEEVKNHCNFYPEFYATLQSFNVRYGHLFKYDLNSKEYRDLVEETLRLSDIMSTLVSDFDNIKKLPEDQRDLKKLRDLLFPVVVALRKEVETKLE